MPEIGQTISHYRIVEKIGQGGMGEVYLADDSTLDRKVALKFLPEAFTSDPERMARFEREAKLLASLSHPNIAGIYGLEQADGNRFLVLEYVEGETLQARLSKGALPLEDSLTLCRQIAEGLEAAHEKGVIHRDLKPANVMITAEEKVKILDFGLAKALSDDTQSIDSSQSPTLTEAMTQPGVILGTAAYMSPEQAKGKSVDKRADIWAFGCILYECLTGKRAFEGETVTETLAAVIKEEPDWNRLPPNIHPRIRLLLERCLEKHSKDRYGSISDARVDIQKVLSDPSGVFAQPSVITKPRRKLRLGLPGVAAAIFVTAVIIGLAVWILKPTPPPELKNAIIQYSFDLPELRPRPLQFNLAVSPDGKQFIYSAKEGLYLRSVDGSTAKIIPGTEEDTVQPFFSPDGESVGYISPADNKLKTIPIKGGKSVALCDVKDPGTVTASWTADDRIIYAQSGEGIMQVSTENGIPETLIREEDNNIFFKPHLLPDGNSILYTLFTNGNFEVVVQSLKSDERKISFLGSGAWYLSTGYLVYTMGNNLFAVPFDLDRLEIGDPVSMDRPVYRTGVYPPQYAVSDSGTLVYVPYFIGRREQKITTVVNWFEELKQKVPVQ